MNTTHGTSVRWFVDLSRRPHDAYFFCLDDDGIKVDAGTPNAVVLSWDRLVELAAAERTKTSPPPPSDDEGQVN